MKNINQNQNQKHNQKHNPTHKSDGGSHQDPQAQFNRLDESSEASSPERPSDYDYRREEEHSAKTAL